MNFEVLFYGWLIIFGSYVVKKKFELFIIFKMIYFYYFCEEDVIVFVVGGIFNLYNVVYKIVCFMYLLFKLF